MHVQVPLALLHNTKSCLVGLKLWGSSAPARSLRQRGEKVLHTPTWSGSCASSLPCWVPLALAAPWQTGEVGLLRGHVQAVLSGNVSALEEMLSAFTQARSSEAHGSWKACKEHLQMDLQEWQREEEKMK